MTEQEPFEKVLGYVVSIEATEANDRFSATVVYANASYDPTKVCMVWVEKPAFQLVLQAAFVTGNLLFFEGIKFYDAALPGLEQFHTLVHMMLYNSPQGPQLARVLVSISTALETLTPVRG